MNLRASRKYAMAFAATSLSVGLAAPPAAQSSTAQVEKATFKVTVEGVQRTTWSYDHAGLGGCDTSATGHGTERVRFRSTPLVVRAVGLPGLSAPVLSAPRDKDSIRPTLRLRGSVSREGTMDVEHTDAGCGGGAGPELARDCGTRAFRGLGLDLDYRLAAKPRDQLELAPDADAASPFRNCPSGGYDFPQLLTTRDGRPMSMALPREELFQRSLGKFILIGRARDVLTEGESRHTTTTRWVVTLRRVR